MLKHMKNSPYGNRTRVSAVRGRRLNRLTNEPCKIITFIGTVVKHFFYFFLKLPETRFLIGFFDLSDLHVVAVSAVSHHRNRVADRMSHQSLSHW